MMCMGYVLGEFKGLYIGACARMCVCACAGGSDDGPAQGGVLHSTVSDQDHAQWCMLRAAKKLKSCCWQ
jgi:hypothetical protein